MMRRFSSSVVAQDVASRGASRSCRRRCRPARPSRASARRFASSSGPPPTRHVEPNAAIARVRHARSRARSKNSASLGFEPGQPPSMNATPSSSSRRAIRSLSSHERRDALALRAVAQRRVVDLDHGPVRREKRASIHARGAGPDPAGRRRFGNRRRRADARDPRLREVRLVARWLDEAFRVPGTDVRIGLDPIVRALPGRRRPRDDGRGRLRARRSLALGAPAVLLARMGVNLGLDALVGAVPLLGDLFDAGFKATSRNARLLEAWLAAPGETRRASRSRAWQACSSPRSRWSRPSRSRRGAWPLGYGELRAG